MARILVADPITERRNILCTFLRGNEHVIVPAAREEEAINLIREIRPDLIIAEGTISGAKLLSEAQELNSGIGVIMILARPPSVEQVVELMNQGVSDVLVSPLDINDVEAKVERALAKRPAADSVAIRFHELIGPGSKMQQVLRMVIKAARSETPVLIIGERGTGKQLLARQIHELSHRKGRPFKAVHCAGLSGPELESELFGHEPGAFSWAVEGRRGEIELSDGGTIYLEEIDQLKQPTQAKLLRFLEERNLCRLGSTTRLSADTRVVAGASAPFLQQVQEATFRSDLYYCLSANLIELPPLRSRVNDIPELVDHFLSRYDVQIRPEAIEVLMNYPWPGNVDELKNALDQAIGSSDSNWIELKDLPQRVLRTVSLAGRKYKFVAPPKSPPAGERESTSI
jgi:DNA-binding NtrC family response regulator